MFNGKSDTLSKAVISNIFWPDLVVADFIHSRKLPPSLDESHIISALMNSATHINHTLSQKQAQYQHDNLTSSNDIAGMNVQGVSWASSLYVSAVFAQAKSLLLPEFSSVVQRKEANNAYEQEEDSVDSLQAEANSHINRLLEVSDVRVTLL
ncbi:head completion/stabilization protein [Shewanella sp. D64]|uniref:head completion/stabilization protein n=1 Tax=unclassified Shewanella TaxID=196818 RepID=UPI0022BA3AD6|nr:MULTISPECIES: head completion/stabilization protein [unclassified Shewanella]MEC4725847.1 head completion/stabilization protein [Shewanella sp. D64]MEC4737102.1 head completion/stabilization protein [Shewanella sp. E94]WBJ95706.1 head completion/stabilization protein [Shewanella sp. MTB7]